MHRIGKESMRFDTKNAGEVFEYTALPDRKPKRNAGALFATLMLIAGACHMSSTHQNEANVDMKDFLWAKRPLLLFAPSSQHSEYSAMIKEINEQREGIVDRNMVIIGVFDEGNGKIDGVAMTCDSAENLKENYKVAKGQFSVILVGKDGGVKVRSDKRVPIGEIFELIDAMPMRIQEMQRKEGRFN